MKDREKVGYVYGERLLKQMGWSEGKGLGKREDGIKEFIKVKKKMNTKGIGFNGVDDKWIEHQEAFDDLLANLNGGRPTEDQQQLSAIEERSRRLGGRVHYSKFLRGKDLSQKKQKDIDAIIIKRKRDKVADDANPEENGEVAGTEEYPNAHTSNVSYQEYFARRMRDLKASRGMEPAKPESPECRSDDEDVPAETGSGTKSRKQQTGDTTRTEVMKELSNDEGAVETAVAKRKRRKRKRAVAADEHHDWTLDEGGPDCVTKQVTKKGARNREHEELRPSDADSASEEYEEPVGGSHLDTRKNAKRSTKGKGASERAKERTLQGVNSDNGRTSSPSCVDVPRETSDSTKQNKSRRKKEERILKTNDSESRNGEAVDLQEGENGGANGDCIDEAPKKQKRAKRERAGTKGQEEGEEVEDNSEAVEESHLEKDVRKPKSRKRKKGAGTDGSGNSRQPDEETEEMPAKKHNRKDANETTEPPKNGGAEAVAKTPIKLLKHKRKASPIVKKGKVPRTNMDQAGRLAQWIIDSPEASKAVDRQSGGNRGLLASQLRNLLLREHRGSNWAQIPGYGSPVWMEKCAALLALTLREQAEKVKAQEEATD